MYGVDLQELFAEQPYVPQEVMALQQQLQQVQGQFQQLTQYQQQQQEARLNQEIQAFQTAVDEQGNPKAPHFDRVFNTMVALANARDSDGRPLASSIQEAYEKAVALNPEIQAEIHAQKQQAEAVTRAAEANRALEASRGVKSKGSEGAPPMRSAREDYAAALAGR